MAAPQDTKTILTANDLAERWSLTRWAIYDLVRSPERRSYAIC
jgi:hypothetical protein